jgi:hypothetical protein
VLQADPEHLPAPGAEVTLSVENESVVVLPA